MTISAEQVCATLGELGRGAISPRDIQVLPNPEGKAAVADATIKILAPTPQGEPGFMIVSGHGNATLMRRAVENIARARTMTHGACAAAILPPVLSGEIEGYSFALWERKKPLPSGRGSGLVLRWLYASPILNWAHDICAQSLQPAADVEAQFIIPLKAIETDTKFSPAMRRQARVAQETMGRWLPRQCIQHGDFWQANVLRATRGDEIFIIDWAGAKMDGYPVIDITRMLISLRCSRRVKEQYAARLCGILACDRDALAFYILAAMGHLGANLEHFSSEKYRLLAQEVFEYWDGGRVTD